jgi:peptidyl-prolyl cis-trans isomerase D
MSVIQRIRDKGAWIVFGIIALALIAFILQDGVRRGGNTFSNTTTIGVINGEKLERTDFEEKLALAQRMYASQGAQREQLIGSVWNQEVEKTVMGQEYDKLGLQVSPKELTDILFGSNSPLKQEFTDPATGEFQVNMAKQAIANTKKSRNADQIKTINSVYIEPAVEKSLRNKYQTLLVQSAYIPKWLLEKQQADKNAIASFSYVYVPYLSVSDTAVKVSDDDIAAYVKKHSNEFVKQEETRNISYVSFSAAPTKADSANTLDLLLSLKKDFAASKDEEAFLAKSGSELPFYNSFFSKKRMQQANKDSLTSLPVGGVYGPYLDGSNYVIAKMISTKQWPDSAKARHILIGTVDPRTGKMLRTDSVAKKLADSIEVAIKAGADFTALCTRYSDDPGSKDKGGVYDYFPQGQMMIPFNDFAFDKPVGSKGVVKTEAGYHYMEVLGQKNPAPAYKIAYLAKAISASNETVNAANTSAAQFAANSKNPKLFNENALKEQKQVLSLGDIKQNDFSLGVLGQSRPLVRWIYEHEAGEISDPQEIGDQYVVAMVSAVNKAGTMSVAEAKPIVDNIVRNEKKARLILDTKFKGTSLETYSASTGAPILRADSLSFASPIISGIGNEPKITGAVFNRSLIGKTSEPIAGATGVFAVKIESNGAKAAGQDLESYKESLLQITRASFYRSMEALRRAAVIKDSRSKFY